MKNEIQLILEEIKNIEESKNAEVIMQDEIGISIDELESLSFEKISEKDLNMVSGEVPSTKRNIAAVMASLSCLTGVYAKPDKSLVSKNIDHVVASSNKSQKTSKDADANKLLKKVGISAAILTVLIGGWRHLIKKKTPDLLGASSENVRQTVWYEYRVPAVSRSSNMNNIFGLNSDGISCSFYTTERDLEKVKEKLRKRFCHKHKMESFTQEECDISEKERGVKFEDGGQGQGIHSYTFEDVSRAIEGITRKEVPVRIYNCGDHESPKEWCCIIYNGFTVAETIVYLPNRSYFDSDKSWQDFRLKVSTFDGMIRHTKELISAPPEISTVKLIEGKTCSSDELLDNDLECTGISMTTKWL